MRLTARSGWWLGAASVVVVVGVLAWMKIRTHDSSPARLPGRADLPRRVTVEVLNSTRTPGVARVATELLRHAGLDVVYFGSADTTLRGRAHVEVLVRRGDTTGSGRVLEALGKGVVVDAPDRSRVVDLTVVIGSDFTAARPATKP